MAGLVDARSVQQRGRVRRPLNRYQEPTDDRPVWPRPALHPSMAVATCSARVGSWGATPPSTGPWRGDGAGTAVRWRGAVRRCSGRVLRGRGATARAGSPRLGDVRAARPAAARQAAERSGTGGAGAGIASGEPGASSGWSDTARLPELRTTVTAAPHASSPPLRHRPARPRTAPERSPDRADPGPATATAAPRDDASTSHLSACRPSAILRRPTLTRGNDHLDTALRTSHPHPTEGRPHATKGMSAGRSEVNGRLQVRPGHGRTGHRQGVGPEPGRRLLPRRRDDRLERRHRTAGRVGVRTRRGHCGIRLDAERQHRPDGRRDDTGRPWQKRGPPHRLGETVAATRNVGAGHEPDIPAGPTMIRSAPHPIG